MDGVTSGWGTGVVRNLTLVLLKKYCTDILPLIIIIYAHEISFGNKFLITIKYKQVNI